jgi:hypothetical protein
MQTRRSANFKLAQQAPTIWCAVNAGRCTRIICISPRNLRPAWACRRNNLVLHRIPCSGADRRWRGSRCLRQLLTSQAACSSRFHDGSVTGIGEQIGRYDDSSCYRTPACHSVPARSWRSSVLSSTRISIIWNKAFRHTERSVFVGAVANGAPSAGSAAIASSVTEPWYARVNLAYPSATVASRAELHDDGTAILAPHVVPAQA